MNINPNQNNPVTLYAYKLINIRVIDGDSIEATLDRGMGDVSRRVIRLYGIDAPESRTRDLTEKKKGLASKEWLITRIDEARKLEQDIIMQSHKKHSGKYGRLLGTLLINHININQQMVTEGLATPYFGRKR